MVNLIFILVISMMTGTQLCIGQISNQYNTNTIQLRVLPALDIGRTLTPKSGNLMPSLHFCIHSSFSMTPFRSMSKRRKTSRVTSSLFSFVTSLVLSSVKPYVRRTSSGVQPPDESKSCREKNAPGSKFAMWCSSREPVSCQIEHEVGKAAK